MLAIQDAATITAISVIRNEYKNDEYREPYALLAYKNF